MAKRPCSVCGEIRNTGRGSLVNIVCHKCRRAAREARTVKSPTTRGTDRPVYTCALCGRTFWRKGGSRDSLRHCSRECRFAAGAPSRAWKVYFPKCAQCSRVFCAKASTQLYCSRVCSADAKSARFRYQPREPIQRRQPTRKTFYRECRSCGEGFEGKAETALYCSNRCRRSAHGRNHRDRAAKYGRNYEPFPVRRVYERDAWVCQLCGDPVSRAAKWPDQMCASLDHIVPLSMGGDHVESNARLAHWLCNSLRGVEDIDFKLAG